MTTKYDIVHVTDGECEERPDCDLNGWQRAVRDAAADADDEQRDLSTAEKAKLISVYGCTEGDIYAEIKRQYEASRAAVLSAPAPVTWGDEDASGYGMHTDE